MVTLREMRTTPEEDDFAKQKTIIRDNEKNVFCNKNINVYSKKARRTTLTQHLQNKVYI